MQEVEKRLLTNIEQGGIILKVIVKNTISCV